MLADGSLSPTSVRLLAAHLTSENHEALLAAAAGKGRQDVEVLLARWFPQPDVAASVRKVPNRMTGTAEAVGEAVVATPAPPALMSSTPASERPPNGPPAKPALVRPLAPERVVPQAAGGKATVDNIQLRCRAHNGHEVDLFFGRGKRWVKGTTGSSVTRPGTGGIPPPGG